VFLPVAVCGNGVCETGEQCTDYECSAPGACRMDCPHFAIACPAPDNGTLCSGTGVCITASGQCECFGGYKGLRCDQCETGFARLMGSTGPCIRVPQPRWCQQRIRGASCFLQCLFVVVAGRDNSCHISSRNQDGVDCGRPCEAACTLFWSKTPKFLPDSPVSVPMVISGIVLFILSCVTAHVLMKYVFPRFGL
jgi:hypothetical protein